MKFTYSELKIYDPIINKIIRSYSNFNSSFDREDLRQELVEKLILSWDYINEEPDEIGRKKLVKTILNNHTKYISMYYSNRPDTSIYSNTLDISEEYDGDNFEFERMEEISQANSFISPESSFFGKELLDVIKEICSSIDDEQMVKYIENLIDPSEEVEIQFEEYIKENPRMKNKDFVPPYTLARMILGENQYKINKIYDILRNKLYSFGYLKSNVYRNEI